MTDTTNLPDGYTLLIDGAGDGFAEERAWVPVAFAPAEADAISIASADDSVDLTGGLVLLVTGRSWHRRDPDVSQRPGDDYWWHDEGGECEQCNGTGKAPEPECAHANGDCDACYGRGTEGWTIDYEPWEKCEADAEGAVEMWDLEITDGARAL